MIRYKISKKILIPYTMTSLKGLSSLLSILILGELDKVLRKFLWAFILKVFPYKARYVSDIVIDCPSTKEKKTKKHNAYTIYIIFSNSFWHGPCRVHSCINDKDQKINIVINRVNPIPPRNTFFICSMLNVKFAC